MTEQELHQRRVKLRRFMRGVRHPWLRWFRIPLGILLVVFGVLGFLPVVGFWMAPLGIVILAVDIPPIRHWFRGVRRRIRVWLEQRRARG